MEDWNNSKNFNSTSTLDIDRVISLVDEMSMMGIKAVEITGGGEPLAHPHIDQILEKFSETNIQLALVTNGTLLNQKIVDLLYQNKFEWSRVSIDAGNSEDYCKVRRCPEFHWDLAWRGVGLLVEQRKTQIISVGCVVNEHNYKNVYDLCARAKDAGVNNIRVSVAFSSKGADILDQTQKIKVRDQLDRASGLNDGDNFEVINLFDERIHNLRLLNATQCYEYCGVKDVSCIIEGSGRIYTCCTLTGTSKGIIGNIYDDAFHEIWKYTSEYRRNFDPRIVCTCPCIHETRNKRILELRNPPRHINFI